MHGGCGGMAAVRSGHLVSCSGCGLRHWPDQSHHTPHMLPWPCCVPLVGVAGVTGRPACSAVVCVLVLLRCQAPPRPHAPAWLPAAHLWTASSGRLDALGASACWRQAVLRAAHNLAPLRQAGGFRRIGGRLRCADVRGCTHLLMNAGAGLMTCAPSCWPHHRRTLGHLFAV
jgi:hypothetical protein